MWDIRTKKARTKLFLFAVEVFDYLWHKYQSEAHAKCVSINFTSYATFEIVEVSTARNKANAFSKYVKVRI